MDLPFFKMIVPRSISWKDLREDILLAIEQEKKKATPAKMPTVISTGVPMYERMEATNAGTVVCSNDADQSSYSLGEGCDI